MDQTKEKRLANASKQSKPTRAFSTHRSPAKDLSDADSTPTHTSNGKNHQDDINNAQHSRAHHESRTKDPVQHEMTPEMARPHSCGEVNSSQVEDMCTSRLDNIRKESRRRI